MAGSFPATQNLTTTNLSEFDTNQDAQDPKAFLRGVSRKGKRSRPSASVTPSACKVAKTSSTPPPEETFHRSVSENSRDESVEPPSTIPSNANCKDAMYWRCIVYLKLMPVQICKPPRDSFCGAPACSLHSGCIATSSPSRTVL